MKIKLPNRTNGKKVTAPRKSPADDIKRTYVDFKRTMSELEEVANEAFDRMFLFGQAQLEHADYVKEHYGTWNNFTEEEGIDKYAASRCRSSVRDFRELGAGTLEEARELVQSRGLKPTAKLMEGNIRRQLDDNTSKTPPKDKSVKREKDIHEIRKMADRINELVEGHDPDDDIYQEAVELQQYAEESAAHVESMDVSQKRWNSQAYLDFCRNINYDAVLGKPVKKSEPMHIAIDGGAGSMGGKVADFYAIPGCRDTHEKLHRGEIELSYEEIADLHRWTMVQFMLTHIPSDKSAAEIESLPQAEYEIEN